MSSFLDLNTSYVEVKQKFNYVVEKVIANLNTSYVEVKQICALYI